MDALIYSIVSREILSSMLESFQKCIHLPVTALDENGESLMTKGGKCRFCSRIRQFLPLSADCGSFHLSASKMAVSLGEPYIFECYAGLNHIVYPLIGRETFLGAILVGPFLMDSPDFTLLSGLVEKKQISVKEAFSLYDELGEIPGEEPSKVRHISNLLYYLFSGLIADSKKELQNNHEKMLQQSRINESIQRYKAENISFCSYPMEKEKELLAKVKLGDTRAANGILNDLLGYVLFSEGNRLEIMKNRAMELSSLLSRTAIEGGAKAESILKLNDLFLNRFQQVCTTEQLCQILQEVVEAFSEKFFGHLSEKNSETVKKAVLYISRHFQEPVTLEEVAGEVHLHPVHFSRIFKENTGVSFKDYLNRLRIEESKLLLQNTDYSIIDIAVAVGFDNQSYFSKVFKKYTGFTPKQFR